MENLDKKIDLKVTMGLRNEFLCNILLHISNSRTKPVGLDF